MSWYKPNGTSKSIIDRIMVSREWLDCWLESKQYVLGRMVLDHYMLIQKNLVVE